MSLTAIDLHIDYEEDAPAATDKVNADKIDADHLAIVAWINGVLLPTWAKIVRDDDTLIDQLVRYRNLHPEVITALQAGLGSATVAVPADYSVTALKLGPLAVITAALADLAVTTAKLADGAVTAQKLGALAVVTAAIAAGAVDTSKIADGAVINAKLAQAAALSVKGNNLGTPGPVIDLTMVQLAAMLAVFTGDSGSGGTKGLVPAPAAGDAAAGKVLGAGGGWVSPAGVVIISDNLISSRLWS